MIRIKSLFNKKLSPVLVFSTIILSFVLALGINLVFAWTNPGSDPPSGNVDAPINTGSEPQTKSGTLRADGGFQVDGHEMVGSNADMLYANRRNTAGGGIWVSDDGGFYDYNNNYIDFRGSAGIRVLEWNGSWGNNSIRAAKLCIQNDCRTTWPSGGEADGYNPDNQPTATVRGEPTRNEIESWGADGYAPDTRCDTNGTCSQVYSGGYRWVGGGNWNKFYTPSGYIMFGPANTGVAHIYTDRSYFYFNKGMYTDKVIDRNDYGYYVDPNGTSRLDRILISGGNKKFEITGGSGIFMYTNELNTKSGPLYLQHTGGGSGDAGTSVIVGHDLNVAGDLVADGNSHGTCYMTTWSSWKMAVCSDGYFLTKIYLLGNQMRGGCCKL